MNNIISSIKQNPFTALIFIVLLSIVTFLSMKLSVCFTPLFGEGFSFNFYTENVVGKSILLVVSLAAILLINKGSLTGYGFQRPKNLRLGKMIGMGTAIIIGSLIIGNTLFNLTLRRIFPVENPQIGFPEHGSILQMIVIVWIWSTICEEIFTRGLLQSFLSGFSHLRFLKLSLPVWTSGLFFGAMHISVLSIMDIWSMAFIVFNTTILGLLAAYYREKTASIYPAMFLHFWFNVIGSAPILLKSLILIK